MFSENTVNRISILAARLSRARQVRQPYCLYIGSAASTVRSGQTAIDYLREDFMRDPAGGGLRKDTWDSYSDAKRDADFSDIWERLGEALQRPHIRKLQQELETSAGHRALAKIMAAGYFNVIMTSNADDLLEKALESEGAEWDTILNVGVPGEPINLFDPTIIKLCGDFKRKPYFVTARKMAEAVGNLSGRIRQLPSAGVVIVGYTYLDDRIVNLLPIPKVIDFVGEQLPPGDWRNFYTLFQSPQRQDIVESSLDFESFCCELAKHLGLNDYPEEGLVEVLGEVDDEEVLARVSDEPVWDEPVERSGEELVEVLQHSVFVVKVDGHDRVSFNMSGKFNYESGRSEELNVDLVELNDLVRTLGDDIVTFSVLGDNARYEAWRQHAMREGKRLYKNLIDDHRDLGQRFMAARMSMKPQEILTLSFVGPREYLGLPCELLHDGQSPVAVLHPLCRQVSGVSPTHSESLDSTILSLRSQKKPLRALFISADTGETPLTVDQEVTELSKLLKSKWREPHKIECETIVAASLDEVERHLEKYSYHLVHFAGHGHFDPAKPEQSGLELFKEKRRKGGSVTLTALKLGQLLRGSQVRLFYLSCCVSASAGDKTQLRSNDSLAVMDALVQAGVPYVIGYRWYVSDAGSRRFAQHFYEHLLNSPHAPEYAAWESRKRIYREDGFDPTWASAILVAQNVHR